MTPDSRPLASCASVACAVLVAAITMSFAVMAARPATEAASGRDASFDQADRDVAMVVPEVERVLSTQLDAIAAEHDIPGLSAAVWRGDRIIARAVTGFANLEHGVPVDSDTKFRIGSVAKVVTASMAARLAQQDRLDLDADVRDSVPFFPDKGHVTTLRQLFGHLGGIRHYVARDRSPFQAGGPIDGRQYPQTVAALAIFARDPLLHPPGTAFRYSTFGYTLASAAMEGATEQSFAELLDAEVREPLGLDDLVLADQRAIIPGRSAAYDPPRDALGEAEDSGPRRAIPMNPAYKWAGGGMLATPSALVRFGAAHVAPGYLDDATYRDVFTRQRTTDGDEIDHGIGWIIGRDRAGRRILHHSGSQAGCRAVLVVWPDEAMSVAITSNLTGTPRDLFDHALRMGDTVRADAAND